VRLSGFAQRCTMHRGFGAAVSRTRMTQEVLSSACKPRPYARGIVLGNPAQFRVKDNLCALCELCVRLL
jgi:hypothetical protein